jgi:hypothetical protein
MYAMLCSSLRRRAQQSHSPGNQVLRTLPSPQVERQQKHAAFPICRIHLQHSVAHFHGVGLTGLVLHARKREALVPHHRLAPICLISHVSGVLGRYADLAWVLQGWCLALFGRLRHSYACQDPHRNNADSTYTHTFLHTRQHVNPLRSTRMQARW